ncbi:MAG: TetR/AcrR family transcriptional regulator [Actinomycetota bacterium]|jgi:AcrR family transcriptional regulator|nr:TetR/AcrR family transcriptional regulator [Actinomycetota bacterium]MDD5665734.1 TetR/AcrR family transcriptional regulator [Actinomycetota bacterium]
MTHGETRKKKRLPATERKKVILDAAQRTFVEFGYHGALMETIAERAEVTKPILYRHFPSKLDLLLSILDRAGEELRASLLRPDPAEMDWLTATRYSIHAYFDFVVRSEKAFRLIYATDLNVDSKASERITKIRKDIIKIVADMIASYTDLSAIPRRDIDILAIMLVGMVETTVIHWMNNKEIPHEAYEDNLIRAAGSILARLPARPS